MPTQKEIKCPKCRFRYDTDLSTGLSEISCVCPRCGTPFNYTIVDNRSTDIHQKELLSKQITEDTLNDDIQIHETNAMSSQEENQADVSERKNYTSHTGFQSPYMPIKNTDIMRNRQNRNYTRYFIILLIVAFVVSVFMIRSCNRKKYYSGQMLSDDIEIVKGQEDDNFTYTPTTNDADASSVRSPRWLQGNWLVYTDYGIISLRIHNNKIAETSGGRTSCGTFAYEKGRLICNFGDGQTMYYKLNESMQCIDAGNGMWMKKTN